MAIGIEFVILQVAISIVGYGVHQFLNFPIERVLLVATVFSIITPFLILDVRAADVSMLSAMIQNSLSILPEQILGLVIGSVVTGIIHAVRSVLNYFNIEFG